ncbi:hypothetical protein [Bacillus atrophaeus]|uniref:hypothetical protein n=1 Tax=Bacillus atrophaeus TaxID=1452 RepID=UPI00227E421D|nr:hypothetical protein [Bacillus atrophaeus]MCY8856447.1 hypothetical protein [Bacillus atrophaeus]
MNWLDNFIHNNETGYLVGVDGSLWVDMDNRYVRCASGIKEPMGLKEISKEEFIKKLVERVTLV